MENVHQEQFVGPQNFLEAVRIIKQSGNKFYEEVSVDDNFESYWKQHDPDSHSFANNDDSNGSSDQEMTMPVADTTNITEPNKSSVASEVRSDVDSDDEFSEKERQEQEKKC